jgi:adenylate cyclase
LDTEPVPDVKGFAAGNGVMVVFNDPFLLRTLRSQAVRMALEVREAIGSLTAAWRRLGRDIGSA